MAVEGTFLLPVHDEKEAEDKAAQMCEVCDSSASTCHSCQKFDGSEYQYEPLCLH